MKYWDDGEIRNVDSIPGSILTSIANGKTDALRSVEGTNSAEPNGFTRSKIFELSEPPTGNHGELRCFK